MGKQEDQLKFWNDFKQGEVKTVRAAKARKAGKESPKHELVPKPKKFFHTHHKASVIVQSETLKLTQEQIIGALEEALEQSKNS